MDLIRAALVVAAAFYASACLAQGLEIIPLRYRTVDQVLPTLRPLLEPGGTMTGQSNQLIIRTSPANLADIRRALEVLDRAPRRLQISVRFEDERAASTQSAGISGSVGAAQSRIEVRGRDTASRMDERVDQRLQVLEGSQAFIATGGSRPLQGVAPPATVIQEATSGFAVVPRLSGSTVFLDIAPQRESFGPGGTVRGSRVDTTVSARLGEWTEIGGAARQASRDEGGLASAGRASSTGAQRVWVRVDELRN